MRLAQTSRWIWQSVRAKSLASPGYPHFVVVQYGALQIGLWPGCRLPVFPSTDGHPHGAKGQLSDLKVHQFVSLYEGQFQIISDV